MKITVEPQPQKYLLTEGKLSTITVQVSFRVLDEDQDIIVSFQVLAKAYTHAVPMYQLRTESVIRTHWLS